MVAAKTNNELELYSTLLMLLLSEIDSYSLAKGDSSTCRLEKIRAGQVNLKK
jgi:hypothetical protein